MTHEETLRAMAKIRRAVEQGRDSELWLAQYAVNTDAILAGAEALRLLREYDSGVEPEWRKGNAWKAAVDALLAKGGA